MVISNTVVLKYRLNTQFITITADINENNPRIEELQKLFNVMTRAMAEASMLQSFVKMTAEVFDGIQIPDVAIDYSDMQRKHIDQLIYVLSESMECPQNIFEIKWYATTP